MSPKTEKPENDEAEAAASASNFTALCNKAEEAALKLIARAEQNSPALTFKLEKKGYNPIVVKKVISDLVERGLLCDERYASLWLRSNLSKKTQSPNALYSGLRKRGIDRLSSKKALENALDPETEFALLIRYIEKLKKSDSVKKNKPFSLRTHLKYEGFSVESLDKYFDEF